MENITFDAESRTVKGDMDWWVPLKGFPGQVLWKVTMVFSPDFKTIESGSILGYNAEGELVSNPEKMMSPLQYYPLDSYSVRA